MKVFYSLSILALTGVSLNAMTVDEAYQAIPHQRTVFQSAEVSMPAEEAAYLTQLFRAVDLAIVARVSVSRGENPEAVYKPVWVAWQTLHAPAKLQRTQDFFRDAIQEEQASLTESHGRVNSSDPRTQSASQKLHQAYDQLMQTYPSEGANIKQAFYDYPCALDFF